MRKLSSRRSPLAAFLASQAAGLLGASLMLISPPCGAGEIYKQTLPNGQVVYSDHPSPGAQKIELPAPQVVAPLPAPANTASGQRPAAADYSTVSIVQPQPDEVIWDDQRNMTVTVKTEPPLQTGAGHRLVLLLDSEPASEPATDNRIELHDVVRGTHVVQAEVRDDKGDTLATSAPVTFHMKQHSILFPGAPKPKQPLTTTPLSLPPP